MGHLLLKKYPFIVLAMVLSVLWEPSLSAEEASPRPVRFITAKATQGEGASFAGIVQARVEIDLAFRTLGRVIARNVDIGDLVAKDQVVAELDPLTLQLAVQASEAELRNAQAELSNARKTNSRKTALAKTNAGSVADADLAEQALKSAEADLAEARAKLAKLKEQLGYADLKPDVDGVVTETLVEVGQTVTAGQTVLRIARLDQRDVVVDVPESALKSLSVGQPFNIVLQLDNQLQTTGTLREIGPEADSGTRTHRLKIALADDAPGIFRLGAVVTATKKSTSSESTFSLPSSAILTKDGQDHVWVINRNQQTVSLRVVQLEKPVEGARNVQVVSGLREGEEIVVAGVHALAEGQKVRVGQERISE